MSAFGNILHQKVKGDVQEIVFYELVLDRYSVSADTQVWVWESVLGKIVSEHLYSLTDARLIWDFRS